MANQEIAKRVVFLGKSLARLKGFPEGAKSQLGFELYKLQCRRDPADYRPMKVIGTGVYEIRIESAGRWFRACYIAKFDDAVYVLNVFEKKQNKTPRREIDLAIREYKLLLKRFRNA